jgi:protoporphyrinogen oxidase
MKIQTLIAGGGLAGLSCARKLSQFSRPYLLVEKEKDPGGLCRTIRTQGFTFDYTGHFLHFQKPEIKKWVLGLVGNDLKLRTRHAAIYSQRVYTEYPYQENNAGLPTDIIRENVLGYLEADLQRRFRKADPSRSKDFKAFCLQTFGEGISRHFMFPYNIKLWKISPAALTPRWMGRFVPSPRILQVIQGAFVKQTSQTGYNSTFYYPDRGGISILPRALSQNLSHLWLGTGVKWLDLDKRKAVLSSGLEVDFRFFVSSLPLPRLIQITSGLPARLVKAARQLKATSIFNMNLGLRRPQPIPYSWVYFPEREFQFHRAGSVTACVPSAAPAGCSSLYVEFSYRGPGINPRALGNHAVQKLKQLGWISSPKDIAVRVDLNLPGAYVLYDERRDEIVHSLLSFLERKEVHSIGRYGRWEYGSMESAMAQGLETAERILAKTKK